MCKYRKGYIIAAFDFTDMLEVERDDSMNVFEDDEQAVEAAITDGIKIIPVDELPEYFDRRYYGWIDTPENRRAIQQYCDEHLSRPSNEKQQPDRLLFRGGLSLDLEG